MPISLASTSASSMHGAVVPIRSQTVTGSTVTDVTFTNIPQNYQDLMLVISARRTDSATSSSVLWISHYYTGVSASALSTTSLLADGTSASSSRQANQDACYMGIVPASTATTGIFGSLTWHCFNYANTSTFKSALARSACDLNGSGDVRLSTGLLRGTGAITTINCSTFNGSAFYSVGSTFTLYGIRTVGQ